MITDRLMVDREPEHIKNALDKVECIARYCGMSPREAGSTCLLAEEMLLSVQHILKTYEGVLWMETGENKLEIHLLIDVFPTEEDKKNFLMLSRTGENTKPRGFLSRIGMALVALLGGGEISDSLYTPDMLGCDTSYAALHPSSYYFSYKLYKEELYGRARKTNDELEGIEKSIIESIADDITVTVKTNSVHLVATKLVIKPMI